MTARTRHHAGAVVMLRALGLGDFLTGVPAYRAIRRAFPGARLYLAAPRVLTDLAPLTSALDELLPTGELRPIPWQGPPPLVGVDLHGRGPASHRLVSALHPVRLIVFGGEHGGGFEGPHWRAGEHEAARWCRLCAESGIPADPRDLRLAVPAAVMRSGLPRDATLIHPGAGSAARRWPPAKFAAVARQLARAGHRVLITGTAAERGLAAGVASHAALPPGTVVAGDTPLARLAALTATAQLVICGDTGMSHLATAYGRPSVTLSGPTPPAEWGPPPHPRHQVLWPAREGYRGDPHSARADQVLAAVSTGEVLAAASRALAAGPGAPSPSAAAPAGLPSDR
jgi:ADP-heptose:LPS heptosyltransferase